MANKTIVLRGKGPGKEPKERMVSIGNVTTKAIRKTLITRLETIQPTSPMFVVRNNYGIEMPFTRGQPNSLCRDLRMFRAWM